MSLNKGITTRIKTTNNFLFTCEKIECEVSSFETISLAFKSGQSWRLKIFPLVPPLVFGLMMKNFRKLPFGTPFKKFSPAYTPKRVGIPNSKCKAALFSK
jgi:hypothetical protein